MQNENVGEHAVAIPSLSLTSSELQNIVASISAVESVGITPMNKLLTCMGALKSAQLSHFDSGRRKKRVPKDEATRLLKEQVSGLLDEFI